MASGQATAIAARIESARAGKTERRRLGSLGFAVVLGVFALNVMVAGLVGGFLIAYAATVSGHAKTNADNLSRALEAGLENIFSQIDLVVQSVSDEYRRETDAGGLDDAKLQQMLDRLAARLPDTAGLRLSGPDGEIRYASPETDFKSVSNADRDYFRQLREHPDAGLVVSTPEFGRLLQKWVIFVARRIDGPDGRFLGEAHTTAPVEKFAQIFSALDVGPHGVVSLMNERGTLIARFPATCGPGGAALTKYRPSPQLAALIAAGRESAVYHGASGVDGVTRLYALRKVGRFPLYLIVALADEDYFAEWRSVAGHLAIVCALFLLASIGGGALIYARAATLTRARAQARLAASVYENSSEGMVIFDLARAILDANPSCARLTDFSLADMRGRRIDLAFSTRRNPGRVAAAARSLKQFGHWSGELWLKRRSGESFVGRVNVSVVADGDKYVVLFADATEQKRAQDAIWRHAHFDPVTELPNRRYFGEALQQKISRAQAKGSRLAVVFIDLDRFKDVNDRFGHAVGDDLLRRAAQRIAACVRPTDMVARLGGDEFTVLLPDIGDTDEVMRLTRQIVATLAAPYEVAGEPSYNSASLGVTLYPQDGGDVDTLLRNADQAMYAAKRQGRNRCEFFAAPLQTATVTHASLASDLHRALANNEIELHYQPIFDIAAGRLVKAEALARWRHPKHGLVPPGEFIPIAEETGLIIGIGEWVFRRAAAQALDWRMAYDPQFQISVNVSAVQLAKADATSARFDRLVARSGLGPGSIVIEITESVLIDAPDKVREAIARYARAGIEIALDDFGTGYSSLAYLKDFDVAYLKLDRAFVADLTERPRDYAICEAVVAMAHKLGIRIIAEGVETEAQRDLLAAAGCDCAQGYLYSRPVPAADFEAKFFAAAVRRAS